MWKHHGGKPKMYIIPTSFLKNTWKKTVCDSLFLFTSITVIRKIWSIFNAKMPSVYLYKDKQHQKLGKPQLHSRWAQTPPCLEEELVACIIKPGELILSCLKGHSGATVGMEGSASTNNEFPSFFQLKAWVEEKQSSSFLLSLSLLFFFFLRVDEKSAAVKEPGWHLYLWQLRQAK